MSGLEALSSTSRRSQHYRHQLVRAARCRDQQCDIRIVNREVSRKHVQLEVDEDSGRVTLASIGREPVSVNGDTVLHASPVELFSGYEIEVRHPQTCVLTSALCGRPWLAPAAEAVVPAA